MYTILLKYAGIAAVHILVMMANISAMQLAVTERVWVDHVKLRTSFLARTRFELFLTVVQSDINKNGYPPVWHDHYVRIVWQIQS